jgi:hypothetical protein
LRWPRDTLYPQKLALTSPTSSGRSVSIVRVRTKSHGVFFSITITINYRSLIGLHTLNITVTTAHEINSSLSVFTRHFLVTNLSSLTLNYQTLSFLTKESFELNSKSKSHCDYGLPLWLHCFGFQASCHIIIFDLYVHAAISDYMYSYVFWDITPCSPLKVNRRLRRICRLHLQGWRISQARNHHEAGSKQS